MKNLITALNAAAHEADNIVGKSNNSAKGTVYASTPEVLNYARPLLAKYGLSVSFMPGSFEHHIIQSSTKDGRTFSEQAGVATVEYILNHESGESFSGNSSMPVNIGNIGLSSADKTLGAWTILKRNIVLGLLGVVEVDNVEKTLAALSEQEAKDAEITEQARLVAESSKTSDEARKNYRSFVPKDGNSGLSKSAEQKILAMFMKRAGELDAQSSQGEQQ